jgi:hypothetical protein
MVFIEEELFHDKIKKLGLTKSYMGDFIRTKSW